MGRWRALKALNRVDEAKAEAAAAATSSDVRQLDAARRGFDLLSQSAEAEAVAQSVLDKFPNSAAAAAVAASRVAAARQTKRYTAVIDQATAFLARFRASPDRLAVHDALIEAYASTPDRPAETLLEAIDARIKARPDPAVFIAGGNALASRNARLDDVIRLGEASIPAAATFINENLGSYKMEGKVQGSLGRSRAAGTDLAGWAYFLKKDLPTATTKLEEADRLSRGADMANQYHLAELARAKGELDSARERYLTSLTSARAAAVARGGSQGARRRLCEARERPRRVRRLAQGRARSSHRRSARGWLVQSMLDRKLPPIAVTDMSGRQMHLNSLRGKVLLLNFFSSW